MKGVRTTWPYLTGILGHEDIDQNTAPTFRGRTQTRSECRIANSLRGVASAWLIARFDSSGTSVYVLAPLTEANSNVLVTLRQSALQPNRDLTRAYRVSGLNFSRCG